MATRRRSSVRESVEARGGDQDIEMRDRPEDDSANAKDVDAEGDPDDEEVDVEGSESRDMYHTIGELSTYLCQVEEECVPNPDLTGPVPAKLIIIVARSWHLAFNVYQTDVCSRTTSKSSPHQLLSAQFAYVRNHPTER